MSRIIVDSIRNSSASSDSINLDSNARVGIGISSPDTPLHLRGSGFTTLTIDNSGNTSSPYKITYGDQGQVNHLVVATRELTFGTSNAERMRIDSFGHVLIGCTTTDSNNSTGVRLFNNGAIHATRSNEYSYVGRRSDSDGGLFLFRRDSSNVGSISVNSSSTAYNTSSDYRLKENQTAITDGITRLKTLKPYRFNWKVDPDTKVDGFFAHEVTAVPEAISGTKDAVATEDSEEAKKGDPIYQQIDQSKLVPLLTAALQEEVAKREALEARVAALEAK